MHIDLCATGAIIEASHLGNLRLKASEIAKIKRRSLRIIANDALGVDSSFGDSDITKGKAKGIKNPPGHPNSAWREVARLSVA